MISKELLSEVFGREVSEIKEACTDKEIAIIAYFNGFRQAFNMNIYELAFKCKSWALDKNQSLTSWAFKTDSAFCEIGSREDIDYNFFEADTEHEAIFKACDYILNELSNK